MDCRDKSETLCINRFGLKLKQYFRKTVLLSLKHGRVALILQVLNDLLD